MMKIDYIIWTKTKTNALLWQCYGIEQNADLLLIVNPFENLLGNRSIEKTADINEICTCSRSTNWCYQRLLFLLILTGKSKYISVEAITLKMCLISKISFVFPLIMESSAMERNNRRVVLTFTHVRIERIRVRFDRCSIRSFRYFRREYVCRIILILSPHWLN